MEQEFTQCDMCSAKLCGFSPPTDLTPETILLPCLHVFCRMCKAKCEEASSNPETLVCQVCRTEGFRSRVLILPSESAAEVKKCESAVCPDKHQAITKCMNCNEALCADCSLAHQRVTATSSHFLQALGPFIPNCVRCNVHNNMRIVSLCQCGSYVCMTCIANKLHEGPPHMVTPLTHLPDSHIDESKIMSSAVRETTQIDCNLSITQARKSALAEHVAVMKKDIGNQVVQICQAVMRRGNDLLRALDAVQFYKGREYDKLRDKLLWQKRRFSRINSYASHMKNFGDPTALIVLKQFLENCVSVIKSKKMNIERNINDLQRSGTVQFKPDTDILANISQWGRILTDDDSGTLRTVEVTPTPTSFNPLNVPLFETTNNGVKRSSLATNTTQRSSITGAAEPRNSNPLDFRLPITQEHAGLLYQQHLRIQELTTEQMQKARRSGFFHPLFQRNSQRYPSRPSTSGTAASQRPYASPCPLSVGHTLPFTNHSLFSTNSVRAQQTLPLNIAEALSNIRQIPDVQLTSSEAGSGVGISCMSGTLANPPLRQPENSVRQATDTGMVSLPPVSSAGANCAAPMQSILSCSEEITVDSKSVICASNTNTPTATDRSGVCFNPAVSNASISASVIQSKRGTSSTGTSASVGVSSPPPKDPEPAPLKMTISIKRDDKDAVPSASDKVVDKDQSKPADPEQPKAEDELHLQAENSTDNDESRWDDYCYVCQQGCDEKTGSLGCCARCPRVFHNCCHIPAIKEQMENLPDEWACSLCVDAEPLQENTGTMGQRERLLCSKVMLSCYEKHLDVEPFCQPVPKSVVNYYAIIKQPMDFSTIARRLKEKAKDAFTNVAQFVRCMNLVFENCSTFNAPDDEVARAGRSVYQIYSRAVKDYLPCMKNHVWLYVNRYSENRRPGLLQKQLNAQALSSTAAAHEAAFAEPVIKKPRKEVKSEFNEVM